VQHCLLLQSIAWLCIRKQVDSKDLCSRNKIFGHLFTRFRAVQCEYFSRLYLDIFFFLALTEWNVFRMKTLEHTTPWYVFRMKKLEHTTPWNVFRMKTLELYDAFQEVLKIRSQAREKQCWTFQLIPISRILHNLSRHGEERGQKLL